MLSMAFFLFPALRRCLLCGLGLAVIAGGITPLVVATPVRADSSSVPVREPGHENIRRRMADRSGDDKEYWEGFILHREGRCEGAVEKLRPIAQLGRGYELAQHTLGLCLITIGGLPTEHTGNHAGRTALYDNKDFREGVIWITRAANADLFQAQSSLIRLYTIGLGPDNSPLSAATWVEIHNNNPIRRALGISPESREYTKRLQAGFPLDIRIAAIVRAREWLPRYWTH